MTTPSESSQLAVIYGRVSTDRQSTTVQRNMCREYLKYKTYTLAAEFYDDAVSGRRFNLMDRPQGKLLRQRIAEGDIQHLIVTRMSRLGRTTIDVLNNLKFFDSRGIVVHIMEVGGESLTTQGMWGRFTLRLMASIAELQGDMIQEQIQDHLDDKRSRGELCGTEPYGFTAQPTGEITPKGVPIRLLIDNPAEQQWILHMVRMRQAGHGYHTIAKDLNARGVPTKRRGDVLKVLHGSKRKEDIVTKLSSGQWQAGNVAKVLKNQTTRTWLASQPKQQAA